ncbi:hypothetical protein Scep_026669 [Stephania cephalantha]|uniref:Uncharacterized protein n=1 Tax=Stephania cephalantha TaxID=152367 RepID=A0AAP0EKK0_9MAGN
MGNYISIVFWRQHNEHLNISTCRQSCVLNGSRLLLLLVLSIMSSAAAPNVQNFSTCGLSSSGF